MYNTLMQNHIKHNIIVVGRGRKDIRGGLNISINKTFNQDDIIYIDQDQLSEADIRLPLKDVDFTKIPLSSSDLDIYFDWSSFYCDAMYCLKDKLVSISKITHVYIPLEYHENKIPSEITYEFKSNDFRIDLVDGEYPLFDWDKDVSKYINPDKYIRIDYCPN